MNRKCRASTRRRLKLDEAQARNKHHQSSQMIIIGRVLKLKRAMGGIST